MEGSLEVQSKEGIGSRFTFSKTFKVSHAEKFDNKPSLENIDINAVRVLLVEDDPTNRMIATSILEPYDCDLKIATDGLQAVDAYKNGSFDIILMDCRMPNMDGYEATKKIRQYELDNRLDRVSIIAFTANALADDKDFCIEAGMDDYISKPVDKTQLLTKIQKWTS